MFLKTPSLKCIILSANHSYKLLERDKGQKKKNINVGLV